MNLREAFPGYTALALALLFPAYWVPTLTIGDLSLVEAYREDAMHLNTMDLLFVLIGAMEIYIYLSLRKVFLEQVHGGLPATLLLLMAVVVGVFHATVLFDLVLALDPAMAASRQDALVTASAVMTVGGLFAYTVLGLILAAALLLRRAEWPGLLTVFALLLTVACLLQLTVVLGVFNVVLFPLMLLVLAVFFLRGGHQVEVV